VVTGLDADITAVAHGGYGVCRLEGRVCFVPYALPGDRVRVRVTGRSKGILWGAMDEILDPSPDRVEPCCPYFGRCGACAWLHFGYPAQAEWKRRMVGDCLARIAGIETDVDWAEDPNLRTGYRTRAEFHGSNGRLGFYASGSHTVVDIERCPLCHENLNAALQRLRALSMPDSVEILVNPEGPEVLIWAKRPHPSLVEHFGTVDSPHSEHPHQFVYDGIPIVNGAFSQSSLLLNRVLVRTVHDMTGAAGRVLDLYCGNGNLSLGLRATGEVLGLDHNRHAVEAADAVRRGSYRVADEAAFHFALERAWDMILLDPPRTGAKSIAGRLAEAHADRIVYVSCDPATLARDLKRIAAGGWRLLRAVAVDLFPHTAHVETVCLLAR
jgi:23S rRNA (uracil1939-C5)-methyltransferase